MKYSLPAVFLLVASLAVIPQPLIAEGEHVHDHGGEAAHVAEEHGLRVLHAWTPATDTDDVLIYMEIHNETDRPAALAGAQGDWAESFALSGAVLKGGEMQRVELSELLVPAEGHLTLEPQGAAIAAYELQGMLAEGEKRDLHLQIDDAEIEIEVQVLSADAQAHPHAGHHH